MSSFNIIQQDGTVHLPNGFTFGPDLTQALFKNTDIFPKARPQDCGTHPFIHYHFDAGQIDGKDLLASLSYYDQTLLRASFTVCLEPPEKRNWENYSLETEAATKRFHDQLLQSILGKPSKGGYSPLPEGDDTLKHPVSWEYPWGAVNSYHDSKGGGTYMTVCYGNRMEEANRAYLSRKTML